MPWFMWRYRRLFGEDSIERLIKTGTIEFFVASERGINELLRERSVKKAGELIQVAETIKLVEDNTRRKKRKEPSETTKAKEEKRGVTNQRFIGS